MYCSFLWERELTGGSGTVVPACILLVIKELASLYVSFCPSPETCIRPVGRANRWSNRVDRYSSLQGERYWTNNESCRWGSTLFLNNDYQTTKPICMVSINSISGNNVSKKIVLSVCYRDHQSCTIVFVWVNVCTKHTQVQQYCNWPTNGQWTSVVELRNWDQYRRGGSYVLEHKRQHTNSIAQ